MKINSLQAGRALAAIAVAAFHLSINMGAPRYGGNPVFAEYTQKGNLGVDFFFVLSGFIILFVHNKDIDNPSQLGRYAYKRFTRLYPIYWLYTLPMVTLLMMGFGTDATYPHNLPDWLTSITLFRFSSAAPPLPPSWTLFHEVAFYSIFAILILNRRLGVAAITLAVACCIFYFHFPSPTERSASNVYSAAWNLYFILGMGAYWLFKRPGNGIWETAAGLTLSIATISGALQIPPATPLLTATGFALLLAGVSKLEIGGRFRVPALLIFIGDASYSIYLLHEAFEGLILKIAIKTKILATLGGHATYILTLAATIAVGCLAYQLIERPLLSWMQAILNKRKFALDQVAPSR